jgi:hypothetical protein
MKFGWGRARRQSDEGDLAALDRIAEQVAHHLRTGSRETALELARQQLAPAAVQCVERHTSTTPGATHALWSAGLAAFDDGQTELALQFKARATQLAIFHNASGATTMFPAHEMLLETFGTFNQFGKQLKPFADAADSRRLQMISDLTWPYLRFPAEVLIAAADLVSLLGRLDEAPRLIAVVLGGSAVDLEPFIPPQAVEARLAAQEVRFALGTVLCLLENRRYEKADEHLRTGLVRLVEMERGSGAVHAAGLTRTLNALKLLLCQSGNFTPLISLETAFDGLQELDGFTLETADDPIFQAAMRARIVLDGVVSGYSQRLALVLDTLDDNSPTRLEQIIDGAGEGASS